MEWMLYILIVLGLLVPIVVPLNKTHFQKMDDRTLIEKNVGAKAMQTKMLISQYLGWIPFVFAMWLFHDPQLTKYFLGVMIFIVFGCLALRKFFGRIAEATTVEIELRKLQRAGECK